MKSLVIQRYANREVRIGFQDLPAKRKAEGDNEGQRKTEVSARRLENDVMCSMSDSGRFVYRDKDGVSYVRLGGQYERTNGYIKEQLDISCKVQRREKKDGNARYDSPRNRLRATEFTKNARHRILEAGSVIDEWGAGAGKALMVTLTLPGSSDGAFAVLASYSGYIANRILQPIRRARANAQWFYVWELQKRGALHMHLCLWSPREERTVAISIDIVRTWYSALQELSERTGIDLFCDREGNACTVSRFWQFDVQMCKRSVAAYFAKYASKGSNDKGKSSTVDAVHAGYVPGRFWGMSRELVRAVNARRMKVEIYGLSEEDGAQMLCTLDSVIRGYSPIGCYHYNFELSARKEGRRCQIGWGCRSVYFFGDKSFAEVTQGLPGLVNAVSQYCSNAVIKGDIAKLLHTPDDYRSMQYWGVDRPKVAV